MKPLNEFCFIDWLTILEYLKVFISWPVAIVSVIALLILHFKQNIAALIDRIEKASFPGGSISTPIAEAQRQNAQPPPPIETPLQQAAEAAPIDAAPHVGGPPPNTEIEPWVRESIPDVDLLINYVLNNPGPTISEYGRTVLALNSERTFNSIFGTQVEVLERLASATPAMTRQEISPYHHKNQQLLGNAEYSLDQYIAYMIRTELVEIDPANLDAYRLTTFGLRFLNYIKTAYPSRWNTLSG